MTSTTISDINKSGLVWEYEVIGTATTNDCHYSKADAPFIYTIYEPSDYYTQKVGLEEMKDKLAENELALLRKLLPQFKRKYRKRLLKYYGTRLLTK